MEARQKEPATVSKQIAVEWQTSKTFHQLDELGREKMFGKVELAEQDYKEVISLAKEGVLSRSKVAGLTWQLHETSSRLINMQISWKQMYEQTSDFIKVMQLTWERVKEIFAEIFLKDSEEREARRNMHLIGRKLDGRKR